MIVLIDGDLITYPCAAASEKESLQTAESRADEAIGRILYELNSNDYELYIRGERADNFRYQISRTYKANRASTPSPTHLEGVREHLVRLWSAEFVTGIEVDDRLGIQQTRYGIDSCIASFDKDLLQIPGNHYNFRTQVRSFVSPFDGLRNFYKQVIAGDGADNVPSFDGKIRNSIPKFVKKLQEPIDDMTEEWDMWTYTLTQFANISDCERNAQLLFVLREENQHWQRPQNENNQNTNPPWNTELPSSLENREDMKPLN